MLAEINAKPVCQVPRRTSRATPAFVTLACNFPPLGDSACRRCHLFTVAPTKRRPTADHQSQPLSL